MISSSFSDHNAMRLEINYRKKKTVKKHKHMEAIQYNQEITEDNQRGNQKISREKRQ